MRAISLSLQRVPATEVPAVALSWAHDGARANPIDDAVRPKSSLGVMTGVRALAGVLQPNPADTPDCVRPKEEDNVRPNVLVPDELVRANPNPEEVRAKVEDVRSIGKAKKSSLGVAVPDTSEARCSREPSNARAFAGVMLPDPATAPDCVRTKGAEAAAWEE